MEKDIAVETGHIAEEQVHKKGRHRKKSLYNAILRQMEFYFSTSNLAKDKFLLPLIEKDPYVDVSTFLNFNKIRKLTTSVDDITKALKKSTLLELSEDESKVRRTEPISVKENVEECTIYVERITDDATHEWLSTIFSEFGNVAYVSIPKYKHNKVNRGFAFIEFEKENDAKQVLDHFESIGCKMSSQISPGELCSITTFVGQEKDKLPDDQEESENQEKIMVEMEEEFNSRKRKRSTEVDGDNKKPKTETEESTTTKIESVEAEEKKKKKSKKNKKTNFQELGLQVLSKTEWRKMRNKYLNNQREKMVQLKQFLYKKKFANKCDENKHKKSPCASDDSKEVPEPAETTDTMQLSYIPGVIVKAKLLEPCYEIKKTKSELKSISSNIQYIDIPNVGCEDVIIRFSSGETASKFCSSEYKGDAQVLTGQDEKDYWFKINDDKCKKFAKQNKKQRGRDKLLKKAEKELGKHIRFEDSE